MSLEEKQAKDQTNAGLEDKATGDAPTSSPEAPAEKAPEAKVEQPKEGKVEGKEELNHDHPGGTVQGFLTANQQTC